MIPDKKELRKKIKALKQELPEPIRLEKSAAIFRQIEQLPVFKKARNIMAYWSMDDEVATHDFIIKWAGSKTILLPVVDGDVLRIKHFRGIETMKPGTLKGIMEPIGTDFPNEKGIDLIIVPGMVFDKNNHRMGRGRGFYDKLLSNNPAVKIGICFDFQLLESVPTEPHDISMDQVIWA
ncbi:MAG TPA: 5-formyltetrahydrofolate cyclo-ligase [Marinilabiliales bacterium]|jgi:5-formyltetrahydrofolate cyclo-ligase|nr:MAG: 5-formyltetrahydrofolate cyclo-ligase [Bacteroidetes bacterium GWA2_40_14]OFX65422.1 MAG: 5-formyltetrahydrofolate cyclo-ligase [Bacteroidetes bacterium GWC2_40_13]OFX73963.1 MAG: 5-formyltetrahydrofolate cyclo-ligase [Bacteroidetes bacterium GWD2_40_43]OFX93203.1 MAG: 5-formyltetrahydrofolate cyclo-ligase [Bacteroidetes bacterium GWE2_40_63]OFY21573.1 MAG: 5-formyltetrahydrofolate cyclo-ligase [Bacteroidetes bacterium GWF2_40_13]OFZ24227.1 MAG: 5-formyltetrahydrofolate cyclo-ligase [B